MFFSNSFFHALFRLAASIQNTAAMQGRRAGRGGGGGDVLGVAVVFGRDGADGVRRLWLQRGGVMDDGARVFRSVFCCPCLGLLRHGCRMHAVVGLCCGIFAGGSGKQGLCCKDTS